MTGLIMWLKYKKIHEKWEDKNMIFFYVRHGDPIYNPDSLTPLGKRQAEAVAKRLALYGVDRIYASTSNRAIETAKPTSEILKKDIELLDFANEAHAWRELTIEKDGKRTWLFHDEESKNLLADEAIISLGHKWYEHPKMTSYKKGIDRVNNETYKFFKDLGYERIGNSGKYRVLEPNNERVALFAHQGFGIAFLSAVLGIPYPLVANHFDMTHTGVTVIEFFEIDGYTIPKVLTLSSDSHLYREGLPTKYNNYLYF